MPTPEGEDPGGLTPATVSLSSGARAPARPAEATADLPDGTQVDRYVIEERLGAGGMGVVYAAYDPELDRRVAIKFLHPELTGERKRLRLLREAQAMARLSHPNVVSVYDVGSFRGQVFVAMELVEGQNLREWLAGTEAPRSWSDIRGVFLDAGRGLAAAHRAGLVHRDFKPENVLVDEEGRALVTDFGLAATLEHGAEETGAAAPPQSERIALETPVTHTGAVMGTWHYMAPEQHVGARSSEHTDQFAYCVSLFEALEGALPFEGDGAVAYASSVVTGRLDKRARGVRWPASALLRGLRTEPEERYESMSALLAELERDPARARRRVLAVATATLALAIIAGMAISRALGGDTQVCAGSDERAAQLWSSSRAAAVAVRFRASARAHAEATAAKVAARLQSYADSWGDARVSACRATRVHREQGEQVLALRMSCLEARYREADALVSRLERADVELVDRALRAVAELRPVDDCNHVQLLHALAPPADPKKRAAIDQARRALASVRATLMAGKIHEANRQVSPLVERAERLGWDPLIAESKLLAGQLQMRAGRYAESEKLLFDAAVVAERVSYDAVRLDAWTDLIDAVGYYQLRFEDGMRWGKMAASTLARLGGDPTREARLAANMGTLYDRRGDYPSALKEFRKALDADRRAGSAPRYIASRHQSIAGMLNALGRSAEALEHARTAMKLATEDLGADHPWLYGYHDALAQALADNGKAREAIPHAKRAIELRAIAVGADHPRMASLHSNLGRILYFTGDIDGALARFERAIELVKKARGEEHPDVAMLLMNSGVMLKKSKRYKRAEALYRRALEIRQRTLGNQHPDVAVSHHNLGSLYRDTGKLEQALHHLTRAMNIRKAKLGNHDPMVIAELGEIGIIELELGRPRRALPHLRTSLAAASEKKMKPGIIANLQLALARALWANGDRPAARKLALQARATFEKLGGSHREAVEAVNQLLGSR